MHLQVVFEKAHAADSGNSASIFRQLLDALEHDAPFDLQLLYQLRRCCKPLPWLLNHYPLQCGLVGMLVVFVG